MKLICDQCGAKYSIADEKVRGKVFKIRCKKCQNVIVVRGTDQPTAEGGQAITQNDSPPAAEQPPADAEPIWYVVIGREQVGPLTDADLEARLGQGEVTGDSFVWQEGFSDWVQLRTVDRFAAAAGAAAAPAPAAEPAAPAAGANGAAAAGYDEQQASQGMDDEATQAVAAGSIPGFAEHQADLAAAGAPAEPDPRDEATAIVNTAAAAADLQAAGADVGAAAAGGVAAAAAFGGDAGMTVEEGPAAAPFDAGGQLAAGMGGSVSTGAGGNDLMSSSAAPGAGGNDGMFSAFDQPPPEEQGMDPGMVGARNENSVLFSLKNLQSLAMGQGADPGPAPPSNEGQTDASGLIDVRALAGDAGRSGTPAAVGDMADDGMPMPPAAPVMIPMVRKRSNTPIIIGAVLGGCLILGLTAVVITLLLKGGDSKKTASTDKGKAVAVAVGTKKDGAAKATGATAPAADDKKSKGDSKASAKAKTAKKKKDADKVDGGGKAAASVKKKGPKADRPKKAATRKKEPPQKKTDGGDADIGDLLGGLGGPPKKKRKAPAKKPPKPAAGKAKLSKKDIQGVVRSNGKRISRCATRIPGPPGQKVKIEMRWEIRPNGRVAGASVLTGKFKNHSVGRCVLSAVKAMRFPSHGGKPIKIGKYPFGLKK